MSSSGEEGDSTLMRYDVSNLDETLMTLGSNVTPTMNSILNVSTPLPPGFAPLVVPVYQQVIVIIMYTLVIVLALGGNLIVVFTVLRTRSMRTVINLFIVSLSVSDILMAVFCIPFTTVANLLLNYWPFGYVMCPVVLFLQSTAVFLSSFTLVAMSIDRYIAIIFPLRLKLTKEQALWILVAVWASAAAISIPTAIFAKVHKYVNYTTAPEFCEEIWEEPSSRFCYTYSVLVLQYFVPLAVLAFTYGHITIVMWLTKPPGEAVSARDKRMVESKRKITKMMVIVVIIYALCWLPLHAMTIAGDINAKIYDVKHMNIVWMATHWLAMSNSMYNPFVYCWMNSKFRHGFRIALSHITCGIVRSPSNDCRRQNTYMTSISHGGSLVRRHGGRAESSTYEASEGSPLTPRHTNGFAMTKA